MAKSPEVETDYTDEEIAKRRDGGLHALLKAPPKPHVEITGKGKPKPYKAKPSTEASANKSKPAGVGEH